MTWPKAFSLEECEEAVYRLSGHPAPFPSAMESSQLRSLLSDSFQVVLVGILSWNRDSWQHWMQQAPQDHENLALN